MKIPKWVNNVDWTNVSIVLSSMFLVWQGKVAFDKGNFLDYLLGVGIGCLMGVVMYFHEKSIKKDFSKIEERYQQIIDNDRIIIKEKDWLINNFNETILSQQKQLYEAKTIIDSLQGGPNFKNPTQSNS